MQEINERIKESNKTNRKPDETDEPINEERGVIGLLFIVQQKWEEVTPEEQ